MLSIRVAVLLVGTGSAMGGQFSHPLSQKPSPAVPSGAPASALPATAVTKGTTTGSTAGSTAAQKPTRRAEVSYANGQLTVKADNSSLNQILREIGRQAGIKITGGVAEERVFGNYGPAGAAEVLNKLLDGTSSNVMLIANEAGAPGELILTPRMGGPTPPNPNAKGFDDDSDSDEDAPRSPAPRGVTLFGGAQPTQAAPAQVAPPSAVPAGIGDTNGSNGTVSNPQSPNGVKTPQEIYQQLQQLRQQQQQQQAQPPQ